MGHTFARVRRERSYIARQRAIRRLLVLTLVAGLVTTLSSPALAYPRPGTIEWISVSTEGDYARGPFEPNHIAALTRDGRYVVFGGWSRRLAPEWLSTVPLVRPWLFLKDRVTGVTELLSITHDGKVSHGGERSASISADGRHVAFSSTSSITPGGGGIFVRDREEGTVERISLATDGSAPSGSFGPPRMTPDGRYAVFHSSAKLVPSTKWNGQLGGLDIYVRDRVAGTTERVSVATGGEHVLGLFMYPKISDDGRFVVFESDSPELDPPNPSGQWRVYVHDRETKTTTLVSRASDGTPAGGDSFLGDISADGDSILFQTDAANLVPNKRNISSWSGGPAYDVYMHDRESGETRRVSMAGTGAEANDDSWAGGLSADGRTLTFVSDASNIVPGDTNGRSDVFTYDLVTGATDRVSIAADGTQGNRQSYGLGIISGDGSVVAFTSLANNLVEGIENLEPDVFARDRGPALGTRLTSVDLTEDRVDLSGWATFSGGVLTSSDSAPPADAPTEFMSAALTGSSLVYRHEDETLQARLDLASISQVGGPGVTYGMRFSTPTGDWEARATTLTSQLTRFELLRCETVCLTQQELEGGYGITGPEVRITIPLSAVGLEPGDEIDGIESFTTFAAAGQSRDLTSMSLPDAAVPTAGIDLGIAPAGTPPSDVEFESEAELVEGGFTGSIDTSTLHGGDHEVWARACLDELCGPASSLLVTIAGDPVVDLEDTVLELTIEGHGNGMTLRARLTDAEAVASAIAGRRIDFYSGSEALGSAVTDDDGVARIAIPPGFRGANRTFSAVFEGDDTYRGSTATGSRRAGDPNLS